MRVILLFQADVVAKPRVLTHGRIVGRVLMRWRILKQATPCMALQNNRSYPQVLGVLRTSEVRRRSLGDGM
jgi:hypothetical protein